MEIFDKIMNIDDPKSLDMILSMARVSEQSELMEKPLNVIELSAFTDMKDTVKIMGALKNCDRNTLAIKQMIEVFGASLDSYIGAQTHGRKKTTTNRVDKWNR